MLYIVIDIKRDANIWAKYYGKLLWEKVLWKTIIGEIEKRYIVLVKSWGGVKPWQQYKG